DGDDHAFIDGDGAALDDIQPTVHGDDVVALDDEVDAGQAGIGRGRGCGLRGLLRGRGSRLPRWRLSGRRGGGGDCKETWEEEEKGGGGKMFVLLHVRSFGAGVTIRRVRNCACCAAATACGLRWRPPIASTACYVSYRGGF